MDDNNEIQKLWQQIRSDNEFYFLMMGQVNHDVKVGFTEVKTVLESVVDQITGLSGRLDIHIANADERMRQIEGRQRLQEQRFTVMLGAVPSRQEFQALEQRVQALEDKDS